MCDRLFIFKIYFTYLLYDHNENSNFRAPEPILTVGDVGERRISCLQSSDEFWDGDIWVVVVLAQQWSRFMVRENECQSRGGRVQALKLISCRSQTQPRGRNNMHVFVCECVRKMGE